ncbi:spexin prohormone 1-like [Mugil cephalus]|uniref:spexin prohormone 1-like n=1 Tax=Mugil cephalus TaxID=48193 RepID=UPI001FB7D11B|nr:spexin prohormone 1-like [Mugil cephalus]
MQQGGGGRTDQRRTRRRNPANPEMSVIITLLVVSLVSECWAAPHRRNWTPQAILYLKGAQRHRSVLERTSRGEGDTFHLVTLNHSSDGPRSSLPSFILLELLQRAVVQDGDNPENYPDFQELN